MIIYNIHFPQDLSRALNETFRFFPLTIEKCNTKRLHIFGLQKSSYKRANLTKCAKHIFVDNSVIFYDADMNFFMKKLMANIKVSSTNSNHNPSYEVFLLWRFLAHPVLYTH